MNTFLTSRPKCKHFGALVGLWPTLKAVMNA